MEYFRKEVIKGVINYYAVKDRFAHMGDYLVIRCGDKWNNAEKWYNVDCGFLLPSDPIPITEAEFVEMWMAAMQRFEAYLPKPF